MRIALLVLLAMVTVSTALPSRAQTSNPDYPVCMRVYTIDGDLTECSFESLAQCGQSATGRPATCFVNPAAKPAPVAAPAPAARPDPAPAAKPAQPSKRARPANS